jgi:hypothetical protein
MSWLPDWLSGSQGEPLPTPHIVQGNHAEEVQMETQFAIDPGVCAFCGSAIAEGELFCSCGTVSPTFYVLGDVPPIG